MKEKNLRELERIEIGRSAREASHTDVASLLISEKTISRYLSPPADTPYALEYCYHALGDVKAKRVLDFGCGNGENSILLARHGATVFAMDVSESLLGLAKRGLAANKISSGVHFLASSAYDIALADESVDVVFGIAILHHLELPETAREVRRVLKKGGRAIFQEPVRNSKFMRWARDLIPYRSPDVSPFERPLTDRELKEFASGFSTYESKVFSLPFVTLADLIPATRRFVHPLIRFDKKVLQAVPALQYYATVRVIEMVK